MQESQSTLEVMIRMALNFNPRKNGGPVVRTGPTAGQPRSRTKSGAWRAKRSDAGKKRK